MARKWGKSFFAGTLALLLLVFDNPIEEGAEVYCVATKEEQAAIVFRDAKHIVGASPSLSKKLTRKTKVIEYGKRNSILRPLGSDSDGTDGLNIHAVIKDEVHAWREIHRGLHEKIDTATGARRQPLIVTITTAGDDKSQIWMEEDDYAVRVVESVVTGTVIDDSLFSFICRIDEEDDPFDPKVWVKAQPHLGRTAKLDSYEKIANEAKHKPSSLSKLKRYFCNIKTASAQRAILPELWLKCGLPIQDITGRRGFAAFDLARSNDFAAVAAAFPQMIDGRMFIDLKVRSWTCEESELKLKQTPFSKFVENGELIVCPGDCVSFSAIRDYCVSLSKQCDIQTWAFDPTFAKLMAEELQNEHGFEIFPFTQSNRYYNEPIRVFLQMLAEGRIAHGGDECLAWQAGNLTIERNRKDEWMPAKRGGMFKIDGMVASLMAVSECLYHGRETSDDSYEIDLI
jgi:phage terminase large subunit-like protein